MNYYQHHIGDYLVDTAHLSILEDGAYRRLMDRYYTTEAPITSDESVLFRVLRARTDEEKEAVRTVLAEFFAPTEAGWTHKRCEAEIAAYRAKAEINRTNGVKGGRPSKTQDEPRNNPKKTQPVSGNNPEITESVSDENPHETQPVSDQNPEITLTKNHKPITNNQEPKEKNSTSDLSDVKTLPPNGGADKQDSQNHGEHDPGGEEEAMDDKAIVFATGVHALVRLGLSDKAAKGLVGKAIKDTKDHGGMDAAMRICGRLAAIERHPNPAALMVTLINEENDEVFVWLREKYGECRTLPNGKYAAAGRTFDKDGRAEVVL
jgi:uncharacterized protein YdaU (DUF1376 family)